MDRVLGAFVLSMLLPFSASAAGPQPVSPGGAGQIVDHCPTFSWSAAERAWGYEVALFRLEGETPAAEPLMQREIAAAASSWTPSLDQCLTAGESYIWFVREKGGLGGRDGEWSRGASFSVAPAEEPPFDFGSFTERLQGVEREVETLASLRPEANFVTDDVYNLLTDLFCCAGNSNLGTAVAAGRNFSEKSHLWTLDVGNLETVKEAAADLLDIMQEGAEAIDGSNSAGTPTPLRRFLDDGMDQLRALADEEIAGMDPFLGPEGTDGERCLTGSECLQFRTLLTTSVNGMEDLLNAMNDATGVGPAKPADLSRLVSLIGDIPGPALYPLYRADQETGALEKAAGLSDLATRLTLIGGLVKSAREAGLPVAANGTAPDTCAFVAQDDNRETLERLAVDLITQGLVLRGLGQTLQFLGERSLAGGGGAMGFVNATIKMDFAMKFGKGVDGLGRGAVTLGSITWAALRRCEIMEGQRAIHAHADDIHYERDDEGNITTRNKLDAILAKVGGSDDDTTLTEISTGVSTLQSELDPNNGQIKVVSQQLTTHDDSLSELGTTLQDIIETVTGDLATMNETLSGAVTEVQGIGESLSGVPSTLSSVEATVDLTRDELGPFMTGTTQGLGAIGSGVTAIGTSLNTHDTEIQDAVGAARTEIDGLRTRLEAVESAGGAVHTRGIERQLASCQALVSLYLPAAHGGHLEAIMELVRGSIDSAGKAGVRTSDAESHYTRADRSRTAGQYLKAFDSLCKSYRALTSGEGADDD